MKIKPFLTFKPPFAPSCAIEFSYCNVSHCETIDNRPMEKELGTQLIKEKPSGVNSLPSYCKAFSPCVPHIYLVSLYMYIAVLLSSLFPLQNKGSCHILFTWLTIGGHSCSYTSMYHCKSAWESAAIVRVCNTKIWNRLEFTVSTTSSNTYCAAVYAYP